MTVQELITKLGAYDPNMRVLMQDQLLVLVSHEITDATTTEFCPAEGPVEVVVQLVPEWSTDH